VPSLCKKDLLLGSVLVFLILIAPKLLYQDTSTPSNRTFSFFNRISYKDSLVKKTNELNKLDSICADRRAKIKIYEGLLNESILKTIDANPKNRFHK
jgi:hypothetical protein